MAELNVNLYDSLHLHTVYSAADNIARVQFPTPCALLEHYLEFFLPFLFVLAKYFRLCERQ